MPIMQCQKGGKPGFKAGPTGVCYTYTPGNAASRAAARKKAEKQLAAINARRSQ